MMGDRSAAVRSELVRVLWIELTNDEPGGAYDDRAIGLLEKFATDRSWLVRSEIAAFDDCPVDILKTMLEKSTEKQRGQLAGCLPDGRPVSKHVTALLCADESVDVRCKVAKAIDAHEAEIEFLERLARDPSPKVRCKVVALRRTPSKILDQLDRDPNEEVRAAVSARRKKDAPLLRRCDAGDEWAKEELTFRDDLPAVILEKLAKDKSEMIRWQVAIHWNTPEPVRLELAMTGGVAEAVLSTAYSTPELLMHIAHHGKESERILAADHDHLGVDAMEILADDKSEAVRAALAASYRADPKLLRKLAGDESEQVRLSVAKNSNTPEDVADRLEKERAILAEEQSKFRDRYNAMLGYKAFFDPGSRIFTLAINVPTCEIVYQYFMTPFPEIGVDLEQEQIDAENEFLLELIKNYLSDGRFILNTWPPDELMETLEAVPITDLDAAVVGTWSLTEKERILTIDWLTPEWVEGPFEFDPDELEQLYRDWFISRGFD